MIGSDFTYNGSSLSDFKMMMGEPGTGQDFPNLDIDRADITAIRPVPNHYSAHYSDTLILHFAIIKCDEKLSGNETEALTGDEIHSLCTWLQTPRRPKELKVIDDNGIDQTLYYGVFTTVTPLCISTDCYGLELEFTCNAPYGFTDWKEYSLSSTQKASVANISSDLQEYLYPNLIIDVADSKGGTITFSNSLDKSRNMELTIPSGVSKVHALGRQKIIVDQNGMLLPLTSLGVNFTDGSASELLSVQTALINWLRLAAGTNVITMTTTNSNITTKLRIQFPRKAGGF